MCIIVNFDIHITSFLMRKNENYCWLMSKPKSHYGVMKNFVTDPTFEFNEK